jgi:hypothetical protein
MDEKKRKDERTRNWTFVTYPESAPKDWREVVEAEHIQWVESPLHEADENADGTQKKAHWHILLLYAGKKSYEQVLELTQRLNATIPQKVANAKGLVRYMAHLDNPEKKQYDKALIIGHGGVDVAEYLKPSSSMRYQHILEMQGWVVKNNVQEFWQLFEYAASVRFEDWFPLLCDNSAYILNTYIKSRRCSIVPVSVNISNGEKINPETGEIT